MCVWYRHSVGLRKSFILRSDHIKKKENIQIYLSNKKSEKNGTILRQQVETRGEREQKIELYRNTRKKKWRMVTSTL